MVKETISMKWTESEENHYDLNIANKNWLWFSYIFQLKINPKN
jgi:hypothetical protein